MMIAQIFLGKCSKCCGLSELLRLLNAFGEVNSIKMCTCIFFITTTCVCVIICHMFILIYVIVPNSTLNPKFVLLLDTVAPSSTIASGLVMRRSSQYSFDI